MRWFSLLLFFSGTLFAADVAPLLRRAEQAYQAGRLDEARKTFGRGAVLTDQPEQRQQALKRLGEVNTELLLSRIPQEECVRVKVQAGDTLGVIAKRAGTTADLLRKMNAVQGDMIREGQMLKVPILTFSVKIDISSNTLVLMLGDTYFKQYPVSTGSKGNTPVGSFRIVNRIIHPVWWHPETGERIPFGDPRHRIGTHWLGWDRKGFGMHGTDEPDKIGLPVSLGCVRLRNEAIEELYMLLPEGTPVIVTE